jgi:hypothetical protein
MFRLRPLLPLLILLTIALAAPAGAQQASPALATMVSVLHATGLDVIVPWVTAGVTIASLLDAAIPQPAAGSHWLPLRVLLSTVALNRMNATNAGQPAVFTWVLRVMRALVAIENEQIAAGKPGPANAPPAVQMTAVAAPAAAPAAAPVPAAATPPVPLPAATS